jgi:ribosomal protein L11 methyltransferase
MTARRDNPRVDVAVKVPRDMAGIVSATLRSFVPSLMWQYEKQDSGLCLLKTSLVLDDQVDPILSDIDKALEQVEAHRVVSEPMPVELQVVEGSEPGGARQRQRQPRRVSSRLAVGLPCHRVEEGCDQTVLRIDPQEAFGDGYHPSTRIALRLVDELLTGKHGPLPAVKGWALDAGCGTGVLALAAAALGGFRVLAVDLDPRAVEAAQANLQFNPGPGCNVFLALGELSCARGPFCLVMANLVPTLHLRVYETLWKVVAPEGWLILSGFCQPQKDSILRPYIQHGAAEKACCVDHAWAGTLLHKLA